ncbi:CMP/dCMP deaminase zinc-binding protein [Desulfobulbus propionicus DSM 2032]|jgi:tRNA(adenine34) deaminase|uniref:CMP/dCMP deaminase zinc-binding protein n=2 Tax=Desulfobulbus propionicus TaxID=894 RepID=A0A7U4DPG3_DESPD|nr:CMP/dCMP deaminase zinc-binding protein [Desulfobulbus propionicus DSM 2032]
MMSEHEQFMAVALEEARLALAEGEFPVGCAMVANNGIVARGRRHNSIEGYRNEIDHAEVVTLRRLIAEQPGLDLATVTVYTTMEPCLMCYATLLLSGIRSFVWAYEDVMGGGANLPLYMLNTLYAQMQVHLIDRVLRTESLRLFQQFFRTGTYWQDSLLARYTLAQTVEEDTP